MYPSRILLAWQQPAFVLNIVLDHRRALASRVILFIVIERLLAQIVEFVLLTELIFLALQLIVDLARHSRVLGIEDEVGLSLTLHSADRLLLSIVFLVLTDKLDLVVAKLLELLLIRVDVAVTVFPLWVVLKVGLNNQAFNLLSVIFLAESLLNVPLSLLKLLLFNDLANELEMIINDLFNVRQALLKQSIVVKNFRYQHLVHVAMVQEVVKSLAPLLFVR